MKKQLYWSIIAPLTFLKLAIHLITNITTEYGLHRDEYLYISESDHLAWGFLEVPPMISLIGKLARFLFGDTEFAVRFFPALIGAISIIIVGKLVRDMGGGKIAQFVGCFAFLVAPIYLGSNTLFQPVSFNQFMWLLTASVMVSLINDLEKGTASNNWYWLGVVAGLGFLTKYSICFFFLALILGILMTPHRKIFLTKYPYISLLIAFVIAFPNLWWQYTHDFPIARHMEELRETQLVNVSTADFLIPQFVSNFATTVVWLSGLVGVFLLGKLQRYRFLGWAAIFVVFILLMTSGKHYYTYGIYSILFALGGVAWETWLGAKSYIAMVVVGLLNLLVIPQALPILPIEKMEQYGVVLKEKFGLDSFLRWEDGSYRTINQDYADMLGWEEIPQKVAKIYHRLPLEQQRGCMLYAGHYGQAGVMNFYRKKYDLPETYSFNASFVAWVKEDMEITCQIAIEDYLQGESTSFYSSELVDSIEHPYARDPGYIYFKSDPKTDLSPLWKELVQTAKRDAGY